MFFLSQLLACFGFLFFVFFYINKNKNKCVSCERCEVKVTCVSRNSLSYLVLIKDKILSQNVGVAQALKHSIHEACIPMVL